MCEGSACSQRLGSTSSGPELAGAEPRPSQQLQDSTWHHHRLPDSQPPLSNCPLYYFTGQVHVGGSVAVLGGKLYVSGGYDNTFELSDVLEAYDPETRAWSVVGRLPEPIFWHGSVSIFRQFMPETTQEDDSITLDKTISLNRQNLHDQNLNELR